MTSNFDRFEWERAFLADPKLSSTERLVLFILRTYADHMGNARPSQTTIAECANVSPRTVRRALTSLERRGWIRHIRGGIGTPATWVCTTPDGWTPDIHDTTPDMVSYPTPDTVSALNKTPRTFTTQPRTYDPGYPGHSVRTEQNTPDTVSPTPDMVSGDPGHCVRNPGHSVLRTEVEQTKNRPRTEEEVARDLEPPTTTTDHPTVEELVEAHNTADPAAWVEALANTLGIDVRAGTGVVIFTDALQALGGDAGLAREYLRWKLSDLAGTDYPPRAIRRFCRDDVAQWLKLRREASVGRPVTPTPTNAAAAESRSPEPDPLPRVDPVTATPDEHRAAQNAWAIARGAVTGTGMASAIQSVRRLTPYRLAGGVLTVGSADPFDVLMFRDKYADLIPLDQLRAEHGVERVEYHLPEDLL